MIDEKVLIEWLEWESAESYSRISGNIGNLFVLKAYNAEIKLIEKTIKKIKEMQNESD